MATDVRRILFGLPVAGPPVADTGLLILRAFTGLALALAHGIGKFPPSERFIDIVGGMGFPAPVFFAWMAGITETIGGIMLAAGVATRPVALMIFINMMVAAMLRHAGDPFLARERALLFAAIALMFMFVGPGRYSGDAMLNRQEVR